MHLTAFESQVLQLFTSNELDHASSDPHKRSCYGGWIHRKGTQTYGLSWGGERKLSSRGIGYSRVLNMCVGRLRSKGLIERLDSPTAATHQEQWGLWYLTDTGRMFLGLPALSEHA